MYQVLYRKYRPKVFSDVYGQDHVTSTLRNEIENSRISHAYLFTGSRGTGKTTCAKILAKAVNCENPHNGEPCNECETCRGLDSGAIYDVVEIDAASNNGVDNIRDLREEAKYTPSRCKYRVFIIDEVHMLSTGAFNALLKTLEEPPEHVLFILATTEVQKLPATILSRCQRFDFKRIQPETMAERLSEVSELEGITLDSDAAVLIARIADGALRDGLSILDQCAGRNKHITSALVSEVAGLAGKEAMYKISDCIASHDTNEAINVVSSLYENSFDMERLCVEMINHYRNFLIVKTVRKSREIVICTDDEYEAMKLGAQKYTLEGIIYALDMFQDTLVRIKGGSTARTEIEMTVVKLCEPKMNENITALLERISVLERAVKNGIQVNIPTAEEPKAAENKEAQKKEEPYYVEEPSEAQPPEKEEKEEEAPPVPQPQPEAVPQPEEAKSEPEKTQVNVPFKQWGEFIDELKRLDITLFGILNDARAFERGDVFIIDSPNPTIKDFIQKNHSARTIKQALYNITGKKYQLRLSKRKTDEETSRDPLAGLMSKAQGIVDINLK